MCSWRRCVCVCFHVDVWVCNALLSPLCFTCCPGNPKTPPCNAIGSAQPNELPAASNTSQSRNGTDHMTLCVPTSYPSPTMNLLLSHLQLLLCLHVCVASHHVFMTCVCGDEFSAVLGKLITLIFSIYILFELVCLWLTVVDTGFSSKVSYLQSVMVQRWLQLKEEFVSLQSSVVNVTKPLVHRLMFLLSTWKSGQTLKNVSKTERNTVKKTKTFSC